MQDAIEKLYSNLLLFFTRALEWYQESPWRHVLHSITQPVELRFADLLDQIKFCSKNIDQVALSAFQAETRDIHGKVDLLATELAGVASRDQVQRLDVKVDTFLTQSSNLSSKIEIRILKELLIATHKKLDDQTSMYREFVAQTIGSLAASSLKRN